MEQSPPVCLQTPLWAQVLRDRARRDGRETRDGFGPNNPIESDLRRPPRLQAPKHILVCEPRHGVVTNMSHLHTIEVGDDTPAPLAGTLIKRGLVRVRGAASCTCPRAHGAGGFIHVRLNRFICVCA